MGGDGAGRGNIFGDVSVGVVEGEMESVCLGDGEETADSAATLEGAVKVEAPDVVGRGGVVGFADDVVGVPEERAGNDICSGDVFGDHAALMVVGVGDDGWRTVGREYGLFGADHLFFAVPRIAEASVEGHIAVTIVGGKRLRSGDENQARFALLYIFA